MAAHETRQLRVLHHEQHHTRHELLRDHADTLDVGPETPRLFGDHLGTVQIRVSSDKPVFVGIAPTSDIERYLARVDHQAVTDFDVDPFTVEYDNRPGTIRPALPAAQNFWRVQAAGTGAQTIRWPLRRATGRPWR